MQQQRCFRSAGSSSSRCSSGVVRGAGAAASRQVRVTTRTIVSQAFRRAQPDEPKDGQMVAQGREWIETILSRFGPIRDKAASVTCLDFEKPLLELDKRIKEVRKVAEENGVDVTPQIAELEQRARQLRKETYSRLTPVQRLQVARHPNRPTCLDIILNITDKFVELHGDRAGLDDPAVVCGIGNVDGTPFMFIGHQKGRNTKENIRRNFGMPQPNGYRKAMRFMRHADKFGLPIITIVDTPGAYAGKTAEELGQGEAIAYNLREMFGLRVPIISLVIGEGGSGGALAIGCANRNLIMENAVYYVASPEACAAILWKSRAASALATEALRITAPELVKFQVMDAVVPEPLGGAHSDPLAAFPSIKESILATYHELAQLSEDEIKLDRYAKFRKLGQFREYVVRGGDWRGADQERAQAAGVRTRAGTWAASEAEARFIERAADADEQWEALLRDRQEWVNRPVQPPGLGRSGILELAASTVELRRRKQKAVGGSAPSSGSSSSGASNGAAAAAAVNGAHAEANGVTVHA